MSYLPLQVMSDETNSKLNLIDDSLIVIRSCGFFTPPIIVVQNFEKNNFPKIFLPFQFADRQLLDVLSMQ